MNESILKEFDEKPINPLHLSAEALLECNMRTKELIDQSLKAQKEEPNGEHDKSWYKGDGVWKCECGGAWRHDDFGGSKVKPLAELLKRDDGSLVQPGECEHKIIKAWDDNDEQRTCTKCGKSLFIQDWVKKGIQLPKEEPIEEKCPCCGNYEVCKCPTRTYPVQPSCICPNQRTTSSACRVHSCHQKSETPEEKEEECWHSCSTGKPCEKSEDKPSDNCCFVNTAFPGIHFSTDCKIKNSQL